MVLQVTGEQLKQVLQDLRGKITPEEGRALVSRALRDRDQADSDKWQVLQHHHHHLCSLCFTFLVLFYCFAQHVTPSPAASYTACTSSVTCYINYVTIGISNLKQVKTYTLKIARSCPMLAKACNAAPGACTWLASHKVCAVNPISGQGIHVSAETSKQIVYFIT